MHGSGYSSGARSDDYGCEVYGHGCDEVDPVEALGALLVAYRAVRRMVNDRALLPVARAEIADSDRTRDEAAVVYASARR